MLSVMNSLYYQTKSTVLIGNKYSQWFKATVGVRQGCVLSPTLFNIFLEQIVMDSFDSFSGGVKNEGQTITCLHSADDIDLTCRDEKDLQQLTSLLAIT